MFRLEVEGFDEIERNLRELRQKAHAMDGEQHVPLDELLTQWFLEKHSEFESLNELFEASGFSIESQEGFEQIPDQEWDTFIQQNTNFDSWQEMLETALQEWAARRLGF